MYRVADFPATGRRANGYNVMGAIIKDLMLVVQADRYIITYIPLNLMEVHRTCIRACGLLLAFHAACFSRTDWKWIVLLYVARSGGSDGKIPWCSRRLHRVMDYWMIVSGTYLSKISNESSLSFVLSMSRLGDPLADCYCHAGLGCLP